MQKDITTKEALKAIVEDIALYLLKLSVADVRFVDKELGLIEKREADVAALCMIDGKEAILHIEIQNDNDKTMPIRMLRYYLGIKSQYLGLPIYQFVIYIGKNRLNMADSIIDVNLNFAYKILDMHTIDCNELLSLNTPDAVVLAILCDFKDKNPTDVAYRILSKIQELTKEDENLYRKYFLMLDTLSGNRDLKNSIKEAEKMLREVDLEKLASYEIGLEKGIEKGIEKGRLEGRFESAFIMLDMGIEPSEIAKRLELPIEEIRKRAK